jgi:hypothetical protein
MKSELEWFALKNWNRNESHFPNVFELLNEVFSQLQEPFCFRRTVRKCPLSNLLYVKLQLLQFQFPSSYLSVL